MFNVHLLGRFSILFNPYSGRFYTSHERLRQKLCCKQFMVKFYSLDNLIRRLENIAMSIESAGYTRTYISKKYIITV